MIAGDTRTQTTQQLYDEADAGDATGRAESRKNDGDQRWPPPGKQLIAPSPSHTNLTLYPASLYSPLPTRLNLDSSAKAAATIE